MTVLTSVRELPDLAVPTFFGIGGGANVRTPCGARRIENLRRGDLVVTRDNGLQPVRMIWTRKVSAVEIAADPSLAPVRLKPRTIGPMMPQQDVVIAGGHRVLVPGYRIEGADDKTCCLVPARELAGFNEGAFVDRDTEETTFYNLVFDCHQTFTVNGLAVESFLPTASHLSRLDQLLRDDIVQLFPELSRNPSAYPPVEYPTRDHVTMRL